jgi:hypothetical protein
MPLARSIPDGDQPTGAISVPPESLRDTPNSAIRPRNELPAEVGLARGPIIQANDVGTAPPPSPSTSAEPAVAEETNGVARASQPAPAIDGDATAAQASEAAPALETASESNEAAALEAPTPPPPISVAPEEAPVTEPVQRPVLASEALMEDLAPVEPSREAARIWCAALGLSFAILGILPLVGLRSGGLEAAIPSLVIGAIAMVAALSRVTYRQRAIAMVVLGLISGIVGLHTTRGGGLGWNLARLLPSIALGAALMFRARYRAYTGARVFLGLALVSSIPFLIQAGLGLSAGVGPAQVGSIIALLAITASFTGFMGAETTGAGPYLAHGVALAFAVELASGALGAPGARHDFDTVLQVLIASLAFVGSSVLAALGFFQIVAWRFAADARRIDLHLPRIEDEDTRDSGVDWSTRE